MSMTGGSAPLSKMNYPRISPARYERHPLNAPTPPILAGDEEIPILVGDSDGNGDIRFATSDGSQLPKVPDNSKETEANSFWESERVPDE